MYVPFSVTTGRRVCADASRPLRRAPPAERGRAVALYRYCCRRRGPPAPGPACRQRGGLLIGGTVPFCPPAVPRPISALACLVFCRYRSAFPTAVPHPYSFLRSGSVGGSVATGEPSAGLSAGLSPPGSRRRSVRSCPTVPALAWRCFGVPGVLAVPLQFFRLCPPALFVLSFGRVSAASRGRRGFRSPCEASSHAARNRNNGLFACVPVMPIGRTYASDRSIDATSLIPWRAQAPAPPGG